MTPLVRLPALSRLDVTTHLALYTAFHRSAGNRGVHAAAVPVVLVSAMCLQAYVAVPGAGPLAHLGTLLTLALGATLAVVDAVGAAWLVAFLLPACLATGLLASQPFVLVAPLALGVHGLAWYATVVVGHERLEAPVALGGGEEDSNVYFRRGYYLGRAVGAPVGALDPLIQFCVAPLAVVQDVLVSLGLRHALEAEIVTKRADVLARLAAGRSPLGG